MHIVLPDHIVLTFSDNFIKVQVIILLWVDPLRMELPDVSFVDGLKNDEKIVEAILPEKSDFEI